MYRIISKHNGYYLEYHIQERVWGVFWLSLDIDGFDSFNKALEHLNYMTYKQKEIHMWDKAECKCKPEVVKPTPHKHADAIKAWADGATIQVRSGDLSSWSVADTPQWTNCLQYRVKPEVKPDVVEIHILYLLL